MARCTRVAAIADLFSLAATAILPSAFAQPAPSSNYTSIEADSDKPVQLGHYASAHKSHCNPAPLPTIRVIQVPRSGTLTVRRALLTAGCPGRKIPALVAFYQARIGATGHDQRVYEVKDFNGEVGTCDVTINIKESPNSPAASLQEKRAEGNKHERWRTMRHPQPQISLAIGRVGIA